MESPGLLNARFEPPSSQKPLAPISDVEDDDQEANEDDEGYEPDACDLNCCDKDCECDDCMRCINNSLEPYDEERPASKVSAA